MSDPRVSVVVPNWNTGPLLRICALSVVRVDPGVSCELVIVDNGSDDASRVTAEAGEAQGLWRLVRRDDDLHTGAPSHGAALDAGLAAARGEFVFTLDSDAWARRPGWLADYVRALEHGADWAGALKFPSGVARRLTDLVLRRRAGPEARYIRPCHALYRRATLEQHQLSFAPDQGDDGRKRTTGQWVHERLVALGHTPAVRSHRWVQARVGHLRHATFVINAAHFPTLRARARRKGERAIHNLLRRREVRRLLSDSPVP